MKSLLLCVTLAAAPVLAADLVARQGSDTVRLGDGPCTSEIVLGLLDPKLHSQYKAASAELHGQTFAGCWRKAGGVAHLMYEDGDEGVVLLSDLKPEMTA